MNEIISAQQEETDLADAVVHRTHEVYQYDMNIANYRAALAALPEGDWPTDLAALRGLPEHEAAAACAEERVGALADFQFRDRLAALLKSEMLERHKAATILAALEGRLPAERREALLADAVARRQASE